jgi:hypothetical protein
MDVTGARDRQRDDLTAGGGTKRPPPIAVTIGPLMGVRRHWAPERHPATLSLAVPARHLAAVPP